MLSNNQLQDICGAILPIDQQIRTQAQARLDNLTKPPGSLGKLEMLAAQACAISGRLDYKPRRKVIVTFAADHGVVEEGVSRYPQEVTNQMIHNFLNGGAGVNVLARHVGAEVRVIDVGIAGAVNVEGLIKRRVRAGTANIVRGPAMSEEEALSAIEVGMEVARQAIRDGADILGTGDMGIGNTTPSAALFAALLPVPVRLATGLGTGISEDVLSHKIKVIEAALAINRPQLDQPLSTLAAVGGLEIGAICGVILEAARSRIPVVVDGFISSTGALVAIKLQPLARDYCFFSHLSAEQGHKIFFQEMNLTPLLDLDMRLGEGTGAALAMGLVDVALKILHEMATFDEAGVSRASS